MIMSAGETKTPTTRRSLISPGNMLALTAGDRLTHRRIATAHAIGSLQGFHGRNIGENGSESGSVFYKSHMIVPFIIHTEGLHTVPNWMSTGLEVWFPVGIDRPVEVAESTHPFNKLITGSSANRFGRPVNHDHSNSFFHQGIKFLKLRVE